MYGDKLRTRKVRWGNAIAIGALTGLVSGIGKLFVNAGNNVGNYMTGNPRQVLLTATIAKAFSKVARWITSGVRSLIKKLFD